MSDNNVSDVSLKTQIEGILEETPDTSDTNENTDTPEENNNENQEENQNKPQIPEQFLNQDGTVKVEDLLKSYNELKPLEDEKAKWEQERTELQKQADYAKQIQEQALLQAQSLGYKNTEEYQIISEIAGATASEYSRRPKQPMVLRHFVP